MRHTKGKDEERYAASVATNDVAGTNEEERCAASVDVNGGAPHAAPGAGSPLTPAAGGLPAGEGRCAASVGDNGGIPAAAPGAGEGRCAASVGDNGGIPAAAPDAGEGRCAASLSAESEEVDRLARFRPGAVPDEKERKTLDEMEEEMKLIVPEIIGCRAEYLMAVAERYKLNIASSWEAYRRMACALANELRGDGEMIFKRLSALYPLHSEELCSQVWAEAMKREDRHITSRTLLGMAQRAGITVIWPTTETLTKNDLYAAGYNSRSRPLEVDSLDLIMPKVRDLLPPLMSKVVDCMENDADGDLLLLGTLAAASSCLPHVCGVYDQRKTYCNLYLFVVAGAASGKGRLGLCRKLVERVDTEYYENYIKRLNNWMYGGKNGKMPVPMRLFVPANSSAVPMYRMLRANGDSGLIFEEEADTLTTTFKTDGGKFPDSLRKAFHHEPISYIRYGVYEKIEEPKLSVILSGTPEQVRFLMPSTENGLFSRFMFYTLRDTMEWRDVFAHGEKPELEDKFRGLGYEFYSLYNRLKSHEDIWIRLSKEDAEIFNNHFDKCQSSYGYTYGNRIVASVRRMGLIAYRIAMVLSILRVSGKKKIPNKIVCDERDLKAAIEISTVLMQHMSRVQDGIPEVETPSEQVKTKKQAFYERLHERFCRQQYLKIAAELGISSATAARYVRSFELQGLVKQTSRAYYHRIKKVDSVIVEK